MSSQSVLNASELDNSSSILLLDINRTLRHTKGQSGKKKKKKKDLHQETTAKIIKDQGSCLVPLITGFLLSSSLSH